MSFANFLLYAGLAFLVILLLLLIKFIAGHTHEKRRRAALRVVASEHGFSFDPDGRGALSAAFVLQFRLFRQGYRARVKNVMHKENDGVGVLLFDYQYAIDYGDSRRTTRQSVAVFKWADVYFPDFTLRPKNIFHKIGSVLGQQDISIERQPMFSARYLLRGHNEAVVRELFSDQVVTVIEPHGGICIEGGGPWLVLYRHGKRIQPGEIGTFHDKAFQAGLALARR